MLPTDMALKTDPSFQKYAAKYAADEQLFFNVALPLASYAHVVG